MRHYFLLILSLLTSLGVAGCANYQVGEQTLFRQDVHTVYVPIFESDSFRRQLGERLTEAVIKRIEQVTPYKVVGTPNADSVLTGRILGDTKRVITEDAYDDPRDLETALRVDVAWTDIRGVPLGVQTAVPLPPSLTSFQQGTHFIPEAGQSIATSQREAIDLLAKRIVEQMELPW